MEAASTRSKNQTRKNQSTATTTVETSGTEEASGSGSQTKSSTIYNNNLVTKQQSARYNFMLCVEMGEKRTQKENHLRRLINLRDELDHIKATDWQYEPIEKYIGQAS